MKTSRLSATPSPAIPLWIAHAVQRNAAQANRSRRWRHLASRLPRLRRWEALRQDPSRLAITSARFSSLADGFLMCAQVWAALSLIASCSSRWHLAEWTTWWIAMITMGAAGAFVGAAQLLRRLMLAESDAAASFATLSPATARLFIHRMLRFHQREPAALPPARRVVADLVAWWLAIAPNRPSVGAFAEVLRVAATRAGSIGDNGIKPLLAAANVRQGRWEITPENDLEGWFKWVMTQVQDERRRDQDWLLAHRDAVANDRMLPSITLRPEWTSERQYQKYEKGSMGLRGVTVVAFLAALALHGWIAAANLWVGGLATLGFIALSSRARRLLRLHRLRSSAWNDLRPIEMEEASFMATRQRDALAARHVSDLVSATMERTWWRWVGRYRPSVDLAGRVSKWMEQHADRLAEKVTAETHAVQNPPGV